VLKRGLRLCLLVCLIGVSLLVASVVRTNSLPRYMIFGNEEEGETSGWVLYSEFLMFYRDFRFDVRANDTVSVYVLDEAAVGQWRSDGIVNATWAYEDVMYGIFSEQVNSRGSYAVLVYLPEDSSTVIKLVVFFSGFEKDLLTFSLSITGVGVLSLIALLAMLRKSNRRDT